MSTLEPIEQRTGALEAQTLRLAAELAVLSWGVAEQAERLLAGMEQLRRAAGEGADAMAALLVRLAELERRLSALEGAHDRRD